MIKRAYGIANHILTVRDELFIVKEQIMKLKKLTIISLFLVAALAMTGSAWAATTTLTATADSGIYRWYGSGGTNAQDSAYGYDDTLRVRWHGVADSYKLYVKFTLPSDFGTATSATLKFVYTGGANVYPYDAYGLKDSSSGQDWAEGSGYIYPNPASSGLTWRNAPANDTGSGHEFTSDATGVLDHSNTPGAAGQILSFSSTDLTAFLNTDSDKVITFMVSGRMDTTATAEFASRENTTYDAPKLDLTYTPVPEPISMALLMLGGLFTLRGRHF